MSKDGRNPYFKVKSMDISSSNSLVYGRLLFLEIESNLPYPVNMSMLCRASVMTLGSLVRVQPQPTIL